MATAALALALAGATGCAGSARMREEAYAEREQAFRLIDEARRLESEGAYLLALERFNRSALVHESPAAWYEMGQQFESLSRLEQAATAYNRALELAPDYQEARLALIALGYMPPDGEPSEEDLQRAAELARLRRQEVQQFLEAAESEATAEARARRQLTLEQRRQLLNAAAQQRLPTQAEVEAAIFAPEARPGELPSALDPTYSVYTDIILGTYGYHVRRAQQLRERQEIAAAEQEYLLAIAADPSRIDARLELGDMLLRQEHFERARYHYNRALEDFPDSPRPYHKLGNYFLDLDRVDEARQYYRRALDVDPGFLEAYNNLAVLDMREGKFDSARTLLDEIIAQDPTYANAHLNRGIIASDIDRDRRTALEHFNRYIELGGSRAAEVRGWVRELQNQPE